MSEKTSLDRVQSRRPAVASALVYSLLSLFALYFFMVAIKLIGDGFTLALGCDAKRAFAFADNPFAGLMVGTVATAVLHSSGTVTSIVVALVGSGGMTIRQGVYVIMGANVGTCVTCIMVAFGHVGGRDRPRHVQHLVRLRVLPARDPHPSARENCRSPCRTPRHRAARSRVPSTARESTHGAVAPRRQAGDLRNCDRQPHMCADESLVAGGAFRGSTLAVGAIGAIVVVVRLSVLVIALVTLVKMLARVLTCRTKELLTKVLAYNGYVNVLAGTAITFAVHSSTS